MRGLIVLVLGVSAGWTSTNLGTPPGHPDAFVNAVAVNAHGAAIADAALDTGQIGFVWQRGKLTVLSYGRSTFVDAYAINERGDIVGDASINGKHSMGVIWRGGKATALGADLTPFKLNESDQVIGSRRGGAFLWEKGTLTNLGTLGGSSTTPNAINASGSVVGGSDVAPEKSHAFLWQAGKLTDLGSTGDLDSTAVGINDSGLVVGFESDHVGDSRVAVEWRNGKLVTLGTFGAPAAQAVAVNNRGDVLIETQTTAGNPKGGLLLRDGKSLAIPRFGKGPLVVIGLDSVGDVIGYGTARRGGRRTFVWRNGHTTLLPTTDGVGPPWGGPSAIDSAYAVGNEYVPIGRGHSSSRAVLWKLH
jgi:probable HAF family extracellular repeat protein